MFCMKCGKQMAAGSQFCSYCGAKAFDRQQALQVVPPANDKKKPPKKRAAKRVTILVICGIAVIAAAAVFFIFGGTGLSGRVPYIVYLSEGELRFHDVRRDVRETISDGILSSSAYADEYMLNNTALLMDDGKTLYYLERIGSDGVGVLYKRDLSVNPNRNRDLEKGERIAANVQANYGLYRAQDDNTRVFYQKDSVGGVGRLYMFADNEEILIARDVSSWWLSTDGRRMLYIAQRTVEDGNTVYSMYMTDAVKDAQAERIDADIGGGYSVYTNDDLSTVYYTSQHDDGEFLYAYSPGGERERLFETIMYSSEEDHDGIDAYAAVDDDLIYKDISPEGFQGSLYDRIIDDKANEDAAILSFADIGGVDFYDRATRYTEKLFRDELRIALKRMTFDKLKEEGSFLARIFSPSILYKRSGGGSVTQIAQFPALTFEAGSTSSNRLYADSREMAGFMMAAYDQNSINLSIEEVGEQIMGIDLWKYINTSSLTVDEAGLKDDCKRIFNDTSALGNRFLHALSPKFSDSDVSSYINVHIQDGQTITAQGSFAWLHSVVVSNKLFAVEVSSEDLEDDVNAGQLVCYDINAGSAVNRRVVTSDVKNMAAPLDENDNTRGYLYFTKDTGGGDSGDLYRCDAASGDYQRIAVDAYIDSSMQYHAKSDMFYYFAGHSGDMGTLYRCGKTGDPERIANDIYSDGYSFGVLKDGSVAYISDRASYALRPGDLWHYVDANNKTRVSLDVSSFFGEDSMSYFYMN